LTIAGDVWAEAGWQRMIRKQEKTRHEAVRLERLESDVFREHVIARIHAHASEVSFLLLVSSSRNGRGQKHHAGCSSVKGSRLHSYRL
jgi:hypothetical protein